MKRALMVLAFQFVALHAIAQEQQAGNAASTDTDGTFQSLIDACDDVDALMLRARIRLQIPRTTEEAATKAQVMLEEGFATCGRGDLESAKSQLSEALAIAEAGAAERFHAEQSEVAEQQATASADNNADAQESGNKSPWWKFW